MRVCSVCVCVYIYIYIYIYVAKQNKTCAKPPPKCSTRLNMQLLSLRCFFWGCLWVELCGQNSPLTGYQSVTDSNKFANTTAAVSPISFSFPPLLCCFAVNACKPAACWTHVAEKHKNARWPKIIWTAVDVVGMICCKLPFELCSLWASATVGMRGLLWPLASENKRTVSPFQSHLLCWIGSKNAQNGSNHVILIFCYHQWAALNHNWSSSTKHHLVNCSRGQHQWVEEIWWWETRDRYFKCIHIH